MSQQAVEGFGRLQGILLDNCFSEFSNIFITFPPWFINGILHTENILRIFSTVQLFNREVQ